MSFEIEAVYENGTLKLDRLLPLEEHQRVKVVVEEESMKGSQTGKDRDWWQTLQEVLADQKKRGFVGRITEVDRSDDGYEQRMREIRNNTTHGGADA